MAFFLMLAYIVVALATVLYSGAIGLNAIFELPELFAERFGLGSEAARNAAMVSSIWFIGIIAGAYTIYGGLKAVVWSDPYLISRILPPQLRGVMLAALTGAVMSSFNSMLNSASTIFTMDLYARHFQPKAQAQKLVRVGRIATAVFVVIACLWAPFIARFEGVFTYIQMVWGFITPGIVAAFLFGMVVKKAPANAALGALLLSPPLYALLLWSLPDVAFLHHMLITFLVQIVFMATVTARNPLETPVRLPDAGLVDCTPMRGRYFGGGAVIAATALLYIVFW